MPFDSTTATFPNRKFDSEQEQRIVSMRQQGHGFPAIASALGLGPGQVEALRVYYYRAVDRLERHAEAAARTARQRNRNCLRCTLPFLSQHAGNRMCDSCRTSVDGMAPLQKTDAVTIGPIRIVDR